VNQRFTPPCQISAHVCNMSLLRGEKPQNCLVSNLNTSALHNAASNKMISVLPTSIGIVVLETDGGSRNASASSSRAAPNDNR